MKNSLIALFIACILPVDSAFAHHGEEFFFLEDYELPSLFGGNVSSSFAWEKYDSLDQFSSEAMLLISIAPRLALSVSGGLGDHGDGWSFTSATPRLHVQLTPPDWKLPIRASASFGYQFVDGAAGHANQRIRVVTYETIVEDAPAGSSGKRSRKSSSPVVTTTTTTITSSSDGGSSSGGSGGPVCDPLVDVDCIVPPPHEGHAHSEAATVTTTTTATQSTSSRNRSSRNARGAGSGTTTTTVRRVEERIIDPDPGPNRSVHNHDDNLWTGRLIIEGDFGKNKAIFNLIGLSPEGEKPVWGYAAGIQREISSGLGLGLEAIGDFEPDGQHELVFGGYLHPGHSLTVRIGVGCGLTANSADFSLRTGFTLRF